MEGSHCPQKLLLALLCFTVLGVGHAYAQNCSKSYTFNNQNKLFSDCNALQLQNAALAWTLHTDNNTLDVVFSGVALKTGGWVGWGINPDSLAMAGTQAFIAFAASNGSTILTYNVTDANKGGSPLKCTPVSLLVVGSMQVEISGASIVMFVTLKLHTNQSTSLNFVWNRGASVTNFIPAAHSFDATDLSTLKAINVASGAASSSSSRPPHQTLKNRHGVLNTVGWGIMLPIGVMAARYLRFTGNAWFYLHVFTQLTGYILGVAGWATGLRLGNYSVGVVYRKHRFIGIVLFAIATLQVTAILLRPKKDHKIRKAWNLYHYVLGTTILILGILNIFVGFDILSPPGKWQHAYIGVLIALAVFVVFFEVLSWSHAIMKRRSQDKIQGANVGGIHAVGNGYRQDV